MHVTQFRISHIGKIKVRGWLHKPGDRERAWCHAQCQIPSRIPLIYFTVQDYRGNSSDQTIGIRQLFKHVWVRKTGTFNM